MIMQQEGCFMKPKKRLYDGYFTVEASFIIPLSFLLVILLLYFGFFCYEKSVSVQCCYLAALRGSNEWELTGNKLDQYVRTSFEKLLEEKQLYEIEKEWNIDTSIVGVKVSIEENMKVPFSKIRGDDITGWNINSEKNAVRNKPSSYIRKYQMLKE